jgi:hypothetical protein
MHGVGGAQWIVVLVVAFSLGGCGQSDVEQVQAAYKQYLWGSRVG